MTVQHMDTVIAQQPTTRRAQPKPYDPHLTLFDSEAPDPDWGPRLTHRCPSRRAGFGDNLLHADEDGGRPSCTCPRGHFHGDCSHIKQAPAIVKHGAITRYAAMSDDDLRAEDKRLTRLLGVSCGRSIRYGVLGDEIATRERRRNPIALRERGQRAKSELFG